MGRWNDKGKATSCYLFFSLSLNLESHERGKEWGHGAERYEREKGASMGVIGGGGV